MKFFIILTLALVFTSVCAFADSLTVLARQPFGPSYCVASKDSIVFLGSGGGIYILNLADVENPRKIAEIKTAGSVNKMEAVGSYLYVATGRVGLSIYDVSNPAGPSIVSVFQTRFVAQGIDVVGDYAFVALAACLGGLQIVDISNPLQPIEKSYCYLGSCFDIEVNGNYAYLATYDYGLQICDISDLSSPTRISWYDTPGYAYGLTVCGDYVLLADYTALRIIDVSNPFSPQEIGYCDSIGSNWEVRVRGNYAYIPCSYGLSIIDFSNPGTPAIVGFGGEVGCDLVLNNEYVFEASFRTGLQVIDISTPSQPEVVSHFYVPGSVDDIYYKDNYIYVGDEDWGLRIYGYSSYQEIVELGHTEIFGGRTIYKDPDHNYVYLGTATFPLWISGLYTIDVSNPLSPEPVAFIGGMQIQEVELKGHYLYCAASDGGIKIIDVSNPTQPQLIGSCETPDCAMDLKVFGNYLVVADRLSGLRILDISDPSNPVEIGYYDTPGCCCGVTVFDKYYVFLPDGWYGVRVINVSNPSSPIEVTTIPISGFTYDIEIHDNKAFVATHGNGLRVIDISNISEPQEVAYFLPPGFYTMRLCIDEKIFVANWNHGFVILEYQTVGITDGQKMTPGNIRVYPNPFFQSLTIHCGQPFELNIYETSGRLVKKIKSKDEMVNWRPGPELSAGIYFVKAKTTDGRERIQKVIYLK